MANIFFPATFLPNQKAKKKVTASATDFLSLTPSVSTTLVLDIKSGVTFDSYDLNYFF